MPQIRPAHPDETPRLTAIAHAAKRHWGYPEQWIAAWKADLTITPATLDAFEVFVAENGGPLAGFYVLGATRPTATLEHFWVDPEAMGRGIGRALFEHAAAQAAGRGAHRLEIESDPHAEGFYQKMGARRIGEFVYALDGQLRILPILERTL